MKCKALDRETLTAIIEGRSLGERVPVLLHFWVHPDEFGDRKQAVEKIFSEYPQDAQILEIAIPDVFHAPDSDPGYRWVDGDDPYAGTNTPYDQRIAITDWNQLDDILAHFPDPAYQGLTCFNRPPDGRYRLGHWWYCLFERHWQLRGMTNALTDYYTDPDSVHRLFRAVTDFYMAIMERGKREMDLDGIFTSDDIGMQTGGFFSPAIFDEFFRPYYKELIDKAHELGMHFWLHACGCIEPYLPAFVDMGLDVIHPIQKHTMDEKRIAGRFGKDLCIWAGFDVQQVIPWGTPGEVRAEVRAMMDVYRRPEGRFLFTAGNGINGDCSLESLEALFEEAFEYGSQKMDPS